MTLFELNYLKDLDPTSLIPCEQRLIMKYRIFLFNSFRLQGKTFHQILFYISPIFAEEKIEIFFINKRQYWVIS